MKSVPDYFSGMHPGSLRLRAASDFKNTAGGRVGASLFSNTMR